MSKLYSGVIYIFGNGVFFMNMKEINESKQNADELVDYGFELIRRFSDKYNSLYNETQNIKAENQNVKNENQSIKAESENVKNENQNVKAENQNIKVEKQKIQSENQKLKSKMKQIKSILLDMEE